MNLPDLRNTFGIRQREFDGEFWRIIEGSGIKRWRKGDPILQAGTRILIGLASYSGQELELAQDIIDRRLGGTLTPTVEMLSLVGRFDNIPGIRD